MQVVIYLDDELYNDIKYEGQGKWHCREMDNAIRQGTPLPKGHWVGLEYDGYADRNPVYEVWECSECGWEHNGADDTLTCYCPNCGAKMEEPHENNNVNCKTTKCENCINHNYCDYEQQESEDKG